MVGTMNDTTQAVDAVKAQKKNKHDEELAKLEADIATQQDGESQQEESESETQTEQESPEESQTSEQEEVQEEATEEEAEAETTEQQPDGEVGQEAETEPKLRRLLPTNSLLRIGSTCLNGQISVFGS